MNMRTRVMERNRIFYFPKDDKPGFYRCDICGKETNNPSSFINSHIIAHAHARKMQIARKKTNENLPASPSYVYNGLFCCRDCDKHFEDHVITISGEGVISVSPELRPKHLFNKLNGKKVAWSKKISQNVDWPTRETLAYRNTLQPVIGPHRYLDFGADSDDISVASDFNQSSSMKRKRSQAQVKLRKWLEFLMRSFLIRRKVNVYKKAMIVKELNSRRP
jgi:hypothetical protein